MVNRIRTGHSRRITQASQGAALAPSYTVLQSELQVEDGGGLLRRTGAADGDGFPVLQLDRVAGGQVPALRPGHRLHQQFSTM